jgi:UDP-glucose 4-epimerase
MKVVVTGGSGFIGSHLVEQLLKEDHHVHVIDNLATGRLSNLQSVSDNVNLKMHDVDITNVDALKQIFNNVDWVFHLAALADIVPSIENPLPYHLTNVSGTLSVLEAARQCEIKRLVYAASSSCYGIPEKYPTPESSPIMPMYPYALTKYLGEQYVMHWAKTYGLPCISLRLFNVYGPRVRTSGSYGAVFGVFLAQKLAEKPLTIVGDGTQTRDFTFVTDVADAFIKAASSNFSSEIFNVGSGHTYSINLLAELLQSDSIHIPKRPGEPECTFADTTKIKSLLEWSPRVDFECGVNLMLTNISDWNEAPVWDPESIDSATRSWFKYLG